MKRLATCVVVLALAACASKPRVNVTALADGRFLIGVYPSGEIPEPDVLGAAMAEGDARCAKDGKIATLGFAPVTREGREMDEIFYTCELA